jgi:crotonobetainyl-CoA:carnitine CoA-transferase CaiB-like acyl-CoA transferase
MTYSDQLTGPLVGKLVIDLSRALAGPHASMMLGDLGARVIKVEPPGSGDDSRSWDPPFVGPDDAPVSTYFLSANRNKESVQLNLKSTEERLLFEHLVCEADVLVENFRPGVMKRLGLSIDRLRELNPGLIVLSITGFGHDGPDHERVGYDQIEQGEAGLMSMTGPSANEPTRVGVPIGDLLAGLYGAFGVVAALVERERTGRGMVVRTSLLAGIVGAHAFQGTRYTVGGEVPQPYGNHHPSIAPYGSFRASDGLLQVAVGNDQQWGAFAAVLGLEAGDLRFTSNTVRTENRCELIRQVEETLSSASVQIWLERLHLSGLPAGKMRTLDEVYAWEQTISQGLLIDVDHSTVGPLRLPGPPLRFEHLDGHPAGRTSHAAPPLLGEHNETVFSWLGKAR